jgi:hypothetical protein
VSGVSGIGLTVLLALLASVASRTGVQTASEAGGTHIRVETVHGPVHLFRPAGYDRRTAGLVIYVHGLYTGVDQAWREHGLAAQFAASGANALFVAPEAPAAADQPPPWSDLESLIVTALGRARLRRPSGPLVAVGHSGAYRTLAAWLDDPALRHLILVDALYGEEGAFRAWLDRDRGHKMTLVVKGTARWADPFVRAFPRALTVGRIPESFDDFSRAERTARLLCLRSQYGHMELITEGRTLPIVLRRTALGRIASPAPRPVAAPPGPPVLPSPTAPGSDARANAVQPRGVGPRASDVPESEVRGPDLNGVDARAE